MPLRLATVVFVSAAAAVAFGEPLTREGNHWVETISGKLAVPPRGIFKIHMRGPVTIRGGSFAAAQFVLKKRVRARNEAEARELLSQLVFRTSSTRTDAALLMTFPERPLAIAELEVRVPGNVGKAWIETHSGDVQVYDLNGHVFADSGAGIIQMDRIGGQVNARTAGGDIRLGQIGGGVRSFTGGGTIEVGRTGGESWFETSGGEILVYESGGAVHASTAGGNIRVGRAASSVTARTLGGRIEVQQAGGIVVAGSYGGAIQVGAAHGVRLEATGGSIRLKGVSGPLRAVSDVGSILAELAAGVRLQDSTLATGAGDITVFIPSNIPLTIRATNESGRAGRIVSDFPEIPVRQASEARRAPVLAEGELNGGGPLLQLTSSGGTIYLRRAQQ
jgi:hypothetical protein